MGRVARDEVVGPQWLILVFPVTAFLFPLCVLFTWKTVKRAWRVLYPLHSPSEVITSLTSLSNSGIQGYTSLKYENQSAKRAKKTAQWLMIYTIFSSIFITFSVSIILLRELIVYCEIPNNLDDRHRQYRVRYSPMLRGLWAFYALNLHAGYGFLTVVYQLRLIHTFKNTPYRLDKKTIFIGQSILILMGILVLISVLLYCVLESIFISFWIIIPAWLVFPHLFLWITWKFMSNTRCIARRMADSYHSSINDNNDNDNNQQSSIMIKKSLDQSTLQRTKVLLDASLRLTLASLLAIHSKLLLILIMIAGAIFQSAPLLGMSLLLQALDACVSLFGLLCTFRSAVKYYHFVFGRLHRWLLIQLAKDFIKQRQIDDVYIELGGGD